MKEFGVGRSTIREAIKLLLNSGFLRVQQGVGTFVADASGLKEPLSQRLKRVDKTDLDEVRQLLELKIVEKAALKRTEADVKKMTRFFEKRKKAAEENKTFSLHLKQRFNHVFTNTAEFVATLHTHEQLLQSITAKDVKKAIHWANKIIDHTNS